MDIKVITKSDIVKYVAVILAMVLLVSTVVLGVRNKNKSKEFDELNSQLASGELLLSENQSEKELFEEEKSNK